MRFSRRHADLGGEFYDVVAPATFPRHVLRHRNQRAAAEVGLEELSDTEWVDRFGRFEPFEGSFPQPLALRYHGHQFRHYNPELGDGRGFLFAQLYDHRGWLLDLATKGSGQTPWSRGANGRLTLKGGVREVLATEMLEALGVSTSRSFSLIETGEDLVRGDEPSPTRSAVLVRLSHSHIRIGTFQRLAYVQDLDGTRRLLEHAIATYLPEAARDDEAEQAAAFLAEVCRRVAVMGAQWMAAGFVHGVLNTDNINVTGESFDYGPWRFLPTYDPEFTAAYFDHGGLYAYGRQPGALLWNLVRLAECLLPLAPQVLLEGTLDAFRPAYEAALRTRMLSRLGLQRGEAAAEEALLAAFWTAMHDSQAPFEQAMFDWRGGLSSPRIAGYGPAFDTLRAALAPFTAVPDARAHPYFARERPCTMLIDDVEAIWTPIAADDNWAPFAAKIESIAAMGAAYA